MRVHVLQHLPFEDLGNIAPNLEARGAEIRYARFYENPRLPSLDETDLVIAMGGSMSVNDVLSYLVAPWRSIEGEAKQPPPGVVHIP